MKLVHYSAEPIERLEADFKYKNGASQEMMSKPHGFWVSVESELKDGWKDWCISEEFHLDALVYAYQVFLKENSNLLHIKTSKEITDFTKTYGGTYYETSPFNPPKSIFDTFRINWPKLKETYQGIIISPYQGDIRLHLGVLWYYGWDCASGCIWDISCIQEIKLLKEEMESHAMD